MTTGILPTVPDGFLRRLREIRGTFGVSFNRRRGCWEVTDTTKYGKKYVVKAVVNDDGSYRPLCSGLINDMRRVVWETARMRRIMLEQIEDARIKTQRAEDNFADDSYQFAKEAYRPFQMMSRDMGYETGKSRIPTVQGWSF